TLGGDAATQPPSSVWMHWNAPLTPLLAPACFDSPRCRRRCCSKSLRSLDLYCQRPGGGMADAEDLKSSGDFSSCGFDSHPGHHSFLLKMNELLARRVACTSGVPHFAKERADRGSRR